MECNFDKSRQTIGDQEWTWAQTDHYVETMASRVDVGQSSFVFTADTGPNWDVKELGDSVSLAIAESTFHIRKMKVFFIFQLDKQGNWEEKSALII